MRKINFQTNLKRLRIKVLSITGFRFYLSIDSISFKSMHVKYFSNTYEIRFQT